MVIVPYLFIFLEMHYNILDNYKKEMFWSPDNSISKCKGNSESKASYNCHWNYNRYRDHMDTIG